VIPEERRDRILDLIRKESVCSVKKLVSVFGVSRITIQRDLTILEESGVIAKVHGGARAVRQGPDGFETRFSIRYKQNHQNKSQIAKKALAFVRSQGCIFIDSSTTAHVFGLEVFKRDIHDLVVVTNAPSLLFEASKYPELKIISTGGEFLHSFSMYAGEWVTDFIERINIDCAFISAAGISEDLKITTEHRELSGILQKLIENSAEVNLLLDSTKLFRKGMITVADLSDCTRIITDDFVTDQQKETLSRAKIEIIS
jgi:DeoR/GlpR family transcriptional regulator of sugar metabolism